MIVLSDPASQDARLAAALIGTGSFPPGLKNAQGKAKEARAYHQLEPYPTFWFKDWKTEDRGPLPRCLPLAKSVIRRGARWLFGRPPTINVPMAPRLQDAIRQVWAANRMPSRLVAMAANAGLEGGVCLKYHWDGVQVRISSLSVVEECRLFYHPHDRDRLLMARIQYCYSNAADQRTYWHREEWTGEEWVQYQDVPDEHIQIYRGQIDPDTYEGWAIQSRGPNPFGVIPLTHIRNVETEDVWGSGDLWDLYRVIDRINLTFHLMDRSNQFDSQMNPVFIDLTMSEEDLERPLQPGQPLDVKSEDGKSQGKVHELRNGNNLRPAMMDYAAELQRQVLAGAGSVMVDPKEFTNKGNLTRQVLEQLYLPLIELTEEKRAAWGPDGLACFLASMATGLAHAGIAGGETLLPDEVEISWPDYFEPSEDEKAAAVARLTTEEAAAYTTHSRAVAAVAQLEDMGDAQQLEREIEAEQQQIVEAQMRQAEMAQASARPGPDGKAQPPNGPTPLVKGIYQAINYLRRVGNEDSK